MAWESAYFLHSSYWNGLCAIGRTLCILWKKWQQRFKAGNFNSEDSDILSNLVPDLHDKILNSKRGEGKNLFAHLIYTDRWSKKRGDARNEGTVRRRLKRRPLSLNFRPANDSTPAKAPIVRARRYSDRETLINLAILSPSPLFLALSSRRAPLNRDCCRRNTLFQPLLFFSFAYFLFLFLPPVSVRDCCLRGRSAQAEWREENVNKPSNFRNANVNGPRDNRIGMGHFSGHFS